MDQLRAIRYFGKVAETGSFTKAAAFFGVPPSSLSRRIADLEQYLGATLLSRTTRLVRLTEIGQRYYSDVSSLIAQLDAIHDGVSHYHAQPMGRLKISSMVGFGERILLPLLDNFNALHPEITLDVNLTDNLTVLGRDDVDLAIRGGYAPDERVIAIKLMDNEFIAVASPGYLAEHGAPANAVDLKHHRGLYFRTPQGPTPWLVELDGRWQDMSAPVTAISNAGRWLIERAEKGEGILMLPRWVLHPFLESGTLVPLELTPALRISPDPSLAIYLLYMKTRYQVPKVRAAVDFLIKQVPIHAGAWG